MDRWIARGYYYYDMILIDYYTYKIKWGGFDYIIIGVDGNESGQRLMLGRI